MEEIGAQAVVDINPVPRDVQPGFGFRHHRIALVPPVGRDFKADAAPVIDGFQGLDERPHHLAVHHSPRIAEGRMIIAPEGIVFIQDACAQVDMVEIGRQGIEHLGGLGIQGDPLDHGHVAEVIHETKALVAVHVPDHPGHLDGFLRRTDELVLEARLRSAVEGLQGDDQRLPT